MPLEWSGRGAGLEALAKTADSFATSSKVLVDSFKNTADTIAKNGETVYNIIYNKNKEQLDLFKSKVTNELTQKILSAKTYDEKQHILFNVNPEHIPYLDMPNISKTYIDSVPNDRQKALSDIDLIVKKLDQAQKEFNLSKDQQMLDYELEQARATIALTYAQESANLASAKAKGRVKVGSGKSKAGFKPATESLREEKQKDIFGDQQGPAEPVNVTPTDPNAVTLKKKNNGSGDTSGGTSGVQSESTLDNAGYGEVK